MTGEANDDPRDAYRKAWADWQAQLAKVHAFFLEGERMPPPQIKGMLNREARAKETYEQARRRLLGIESD